MFGDLKAFLLPFFHYLFDYFLTILYVTQSQLFLGPHPAPKEKAVWAWLLIIHEIELIDPDWCFGVIGVTQPWANPIAWVDNFTVNQFRTSILGLSEEHPDMFDCSFKNIDQLRSGLAFFEATVLMSKNIVRIPSIDEFFPCQLFPAVLEEAIGEVGEGDEEKIFGDRFVHRN